MAETTIRPRELSARGHQQSTSPFLTRAKARVILTLMTSLAVLATLKNLSNRNPLVSLRDLRAALPRLSRSEQDAAIAELEAAGLVFMHFHDGAALQSAEQRAPYIHRDGVYYHAIARRRVAL